MGDYYNMRNCTKGWSTRKIENHWYRIIPFSLVSLFSHIEQSVQWERCLIASQILPLVFKGGSWYWEQNMGAKIQRGKQAHGIINSKGREAVWVLVTSQRERKYPKKRSQVHGHKPAMSQSRWAQPGTTVAACRCKHPTESSSQHLTASSQGCLQ